MAAQNQAYKRNVAMMREQNQFNADQAQINREWNAQMDSTKYQRTVADMQSAGVNPALAMDGGVTTQAASNSAASATATPQLDLSSVVQMAMQAKQLRIQEKMADADIRVKNAEADIKEADAGVRNEYNQLMLDGMKKANSLTDSQVDQIRHNISKLDEQVELLKKQAATEDERKLLVAAQRSVQAATERKTDQEIKNMVALLPFQQNLAAARTEAAKASAAAQFVHAAYEQGLIDTGFIEATVRQTNADASEKETRQLAEDFEYKLRSGNIFDQNTTAGKVGKTAIVASRVLGSILGNVSQGLIGSVAKAVAK